MYVPVLKSRVVELDTLNQLIKTGLSKETIPLIEIVQEKKRSNSSKNMYDEIKGIFEDSNHSFFIDIAKKRDLKNTKPAIQSFLTQVNRTEEFSFEMINLFKDIKGCIPVLSFHENQLLITEEILKIKSILNKNGIALRLSTTQFLAAHNFLEQILDENDYLIYDIDEISFEDVSLKNSFERLKTIKRIVGFKTIILHSNKPVTVLNKDINDGSVITEINNSLKDNYYKSRFGQFDYFSDYAGMTSSLPSNGGALSPAGIYYSAKGNYFVGYRYRDNIRELSEFKDYIAPSIIASSYWREYEADHHNICPGCSTIRAIADGKVSGSSQGKWKGITIGHYIYTIDNIN